tara:strand:- start:17938 stop:18594 length:657 start_codon:yes stop_codon:yes gene_type:complete
LTDNIVEIFSILKSKYGEIEWEPRYEPIMELVYTILSQHTSDINSERAFVNLLNEFENDPYQIAKADVHSISEIIRSAGLFRKKAAVIKDVLNQIHNKLNSFDLNFLQYMSLKDAKQWLTDLNGIGPKTAAIVLCFCFGMPAMPVDTHVHRVSKRLRLISSDVTAEDAHEILEDNVEDEIIFPFHMYLIKHGRDTCKALNPRCSGCILSKICPSSSVS